MIQNRPSLFLLYPLFLYNPRGLPFSHLLSLLCLVVEKQLFGLSGARFIVEGLFESFSNILFSGPT
ncbi:hypothetical protein AKJ57_02565 [candidate division MSBL1 archaeon SCGC-AAA259A05]|uniref:Uncharacterized protein n=1 Tax=candidate division MSBL1 archaeon SCGC-AAA259A05 TaxID=1698259 RepID=A0A133UA88_9EURY|nr:hypothetical protein AKJ57_02565 [candidate division MSBL1 archaeon SCGC-AAA259A05]